jgi:hypothetical protein
MMWIGKIGGVLSVLLVIGCTARSGAASSGDCDRVIQQSASILKTYDRNADEKIDEKEWKAVGDKINRMIQENKQKYHTEDSTTASQLFHNRDLNRDGYLDLSELALVPVNEHLEMRSCV